MAVAQLNVSGQTLVNRYSFSDTDDGAGNYGASIADSVGGAAWDGTLPNGGDLASNPGQLTFSAGSSQYVQLPAGILSNYTAVTIDVWATFPDQLPGNCFLYGFGNTDGGGAGEEYIFCQPENGRMAITGVDPGYLGEQGCGGAGDFSFQTVHVTSVYNPPAGSIELYTNGVLVSANNAITVPMSSISQQLAYIARSLYNGDQYMDIQLDEFRIWNGALNPLQVAGCDVAGPNVVGSAANAGTVTNIQLGVPFYTLEQGGKEASTVIGHASAFTGSIDLTTLATFSSSKTNILTVNAAGVISTVGQGSATITATYGTVTSSQIITVVAPAAALVHEYSFGDAVGSTTVADSVGGAAWNGTLPNGGTFDGTGQVTFDSASQQYVQLPANILSNYAAVTIDTWATFPDALPGNCFFFGFGNTDGGGAGEKYIYLQPSSGHIGITGVDPGYTGEQQAGTYGNLSFHTNIHVTAVFNPPAGYVAVYTNGVLAGKNTSETVLMSSVSSVLNYIGRSLYTGDSYMDITYDEFRIFDGAVTSQGVAIADAAGPNSIPSGVLNGPGALQSLSIQAPATLTMPLPGSVKLLANYANLTGWDIIANSVFAPVGLTVYTSNTNVLIYGSDNLLHGVNPGTASVVVVYQGTTNVASVTVVQAPPATLTHRYSFFNETDGSLIATDLVAGANGTLVGAANITGGQLVIPNTAQLAPASDYMLLPDGILTNDVDGILATNAAETSYNDPAVTVEAWATFAPSQGYWAALFDFGYQDSGEAAYDIHLGQLGGTTTFAIANSDNANGDNQTGYAGSLRGDTNVHIVVVFDPPAGYLACYTNGVLASLLNGVTISMAGVWGTLNEVGADLWPDPGMQGSISEFRIYNGVLSPVDIRVTDALGASQTLATNPTIGAAISGGNLVLSWPKAAGAFGLQSTSSLTGPWTAVASPAAQLIGSQWQVTLPASGGKQYFRLMR